MATLLSYASGPSEIPLLGETIPANFARSVNSFGDSDALVDCPSGRRWTYEELDREIDLAARAFLAAGVRKGDRVGIFAPNCPEWIFVQLATAKVGAILVNVNPAYRAHELAYALKHSGISFLVCYHATDRADFPGLVASVRQDCPELRETVVVGERSWEDWWRSAERTSTDELSEAPGDLDPDEAINIQYTSGTTGFPKGATLSHHGILNNAFTIGELLAYTEADRVCVPVPFYHCFGMVLGNLAAVSHGSCIVIPAATFDPLSTLEAVESERCTSLYGVPTMFIAELNEPSRPGRDFSALRTGVMAGSPCPVEVMKQVVDEMNMREVAICYGMTETSPVSTQTRTDDDLERRTSTVGRVMPHVEIKVVDPVTGRVLPRGEPGELCTRGYCVMLGYWNDPEATSLAIDAARYMHTGDLAVMREDGYVNIVGRIKDMVIRGGENIYPREVEEFLYGHPDILSVQVVGVPDSFYGEELCAWIQLREGAALLGAAELAEYCAGRLSRYKIPRYVHLTDEFPMTVTGKVRKVEMRERSIEIFGLDAAAGIESA